jgi:hypothetical protein
LPVSLYLKEHFRSNFNAPGKVEMHFWEWEICELLNAFFCFKKRALQRKVGGFPRQDISSSTQIFPVGRVGTAFYLFERISGQSFS